MSAPGALKLMRKPRVCDSCRVAPWPSLGIGCPTSWSDQPAALRSVYLWHCGAPACEADCRARYAAALRDAGRADLAAKLEGAARPAACAAPAPADRPAPAPAPRPRPDPAPPAGQGSLFGV